MARRSVSVISFVNKLQKEVKARAKEESRLGIPLAGSPINKSGYQIVSPAMEARRQEQTLGIPAMQEMLKPWDS